MKSIKAFKYEPFKLKINTVVMRGCNEDELLDFVKWSEESGISVRFLELIKLGCGVDRHDEQFISALDMKRVIEEQFELRSEFSELDSTSINYQSRRILGKLDLLLRNPCLFVKLLKAKTDSKRVSCVPV